MKATNIAKIAGYSLLLMAVVAGFAFGYAHSSLIDAGNPVQTLENLKAAPLLFNAEIISWIVILILDVIVALALHFYFARENEQVSLFTAWMRLIYSAILGASILGLTSAAQMLHADWMTYESFQADMIMSNIQSFEGLWSIGLIVFGLHLIGLGALAFTSSNGSKFWGILLFIAGFGYTFLHSAKLLATGTSFPMEMIETILAVPMTIGELGFAFWLIIRGGKQQPQPNKSFAQLKTTA